MRRLPEATFVYLAREAFSFSSFSSALHKFQNKGLEIKKECLFKDYFV